MISEAASENLVKELDKVEEVQQILGLEDFFRKKKNSHCLQWTAATNQLAGTHGTFFPKELTKDQFVSLMTELLPQLTNPFLLPKTSRRTCPFRKFTAVLN